MLTTCQHYKTMRTPACNAISFKLRLRSITFTLIGQETCRAHGLRHIAQVPLTRVKIPFSLFNRKKGKWGLIIATAQWTCMQYAPLSSKLNDREGSLHNSCLLRTTKRATVGQRALHTRTSTMKQSTTPEMYYVIYSMRIEKAWSLWMCGDTN